MSDASGNEDEEDYELPAPLIPPRAATPQQAIFAIAFVFFVGIAIGFALAKTV